MSPLSVPSRRRAGLLIAGLALSGVMSACAPLVVGGAAVGTALVAVDRRTSGAQLDDQGIELRASNRIKEQFGERANVSVTSYNRQVLLTGEAASEAVKAEVERVVAGVDNVRSIVNELAVVNSPTFSQRSSDTLITGKVKAGMVDAKDLSAVAFKVVTTRGTVYMMGRVTQREANRATEIARNTSGVTRVVRVFEILTEEELARIGTQGPTESPASRPAPQPN
ncbi:BON domain-containing protein [Hydrogenophaga sp. IBVHS2]|uniref:BON domain-containing protein n=1 Tax=Hydrogenophaga sp. IBVHS2 TaxID=1985170 RepID=UPI000A32479D|nr:BON domain-containing protein [Hydrogenophaga sp. IBVHS2]